jgi:hypothetical protein
MSAREGVNSMAAVSADGSTVWVLIRRLNSACNRSITFVVRALRHWLGAIEDEPPDRFFGQRSGIPGVPGALHLASDPAHRILADRSAEPEPSARRTRRVLLPSRWCWRLARRQRACGAGKSATLGSFHSVVLPLGAFSLARGTLIFKSDQSKDDPMRRDRVAVNHLDRARRNRFGTCGQGKYEQQDVRRIWASEQFRK